MSMDLLLPQDDTPLTWQAPTTHKETTPKTEPAGELDCRILLAEDNIVNQRVARARQLLEAVLADPIDQNAALGRFTNFVNLMNLAAVAVPAGFTHEAPIGNNFELDARADRLAIELDNVVQSAPEVQEAQFDGEVSITGQFSEREARDLALVLRFGALPVELEPQSTQRVLE